MADRKTLESWIAEGLILDPRSLAPRAVDLIHALFSLCGVEGLELTSEARQLSERIGEADHYVFVLIDGLGIELLARCPPAGFLDEHVWAELFAVFPSTTAAALTSFATGAYPSRHGVLSWWLYLRERDLTATVLPFEERFSGGDLRELGVTPNEILVVPSLLPRTRRASLTVTPADIVDSVYSRYVRGDTPAVGYNDSADGFERVARHIEEAKRPTYTTIYLPQVDSLCHEEGLDSRGVKVTLAGFDRQLAELRRRLPSSTRIVVTGDHGLVDLPEERALFFEEGDPLLAELLCPPAGEPTVPFFYVRPGREEAFRDGFQERFADAFALLTLAEAEELALFGPDAFSPLARRRVGDLIAIAPRPTALYYRPCGAEVFRHRGVHAGLTRAEMAVPLILA